MLRKITKSILIIVLTILLLLDMSVFVKAEEWFKGGTLHKATVREWTNASYRNRLATAGDWFNEITKISNPELKKKLDNMNYNQWLMAAKELSRQLEICVSELALNERFVNPSDQISEVAAICYISMYPNSE